MKPSKDKTKKYRKKNYFALNFNLSTGYDFFTLFSDNNDSLVKQINSTLTGLPGIKGGAGINYFYKNFIFQSGIDLKVYRQGFLYSTIHNSFYIRTDTIEKYYSSVSGNDTNWIYITDKKEVERETLNNNQSILNYYYLQVPFLIGYKITIFG